MGMDFNIENNLYEILNKYFNGNLKYSFIFLNFVFIITNDDKVYEFPRNLATNIKILAISLNKNNKDIELFIKDYVIENMCNKTVMDIKVNNIETIALTENGEVWIWNHMIRGHLDVPQNRNKCQFINILPHKNIIQIVSNPAITLLLLKTGETFAITTSDFKIIYNQSNQVISYKKNVTPFKILEEHIVYLSTGMYHAMSISKSGKIFAWGYNNNQQINCSNEMQYNLIEPKQLDDILDIIKICCGSSYTTFLSKHGCIFIRGNKSWQNIFKFNDQNRCYEMESKEKFIDVMIHPLHTVIIGKTENYIYIFTGSIVNQIDIKENFVERFFIDRFNETFKRSESKLVRFKENKVQNGKFSNYENNLIGEGGYGQVFEAIDPLFPKNVFAVKMITFSDDIKSEIINELKTCTELVRLKSSNIASYLDLWLEDDYKSENENQIKTGFKLFIAMEYCDKTLKELFDEIRFDRNTYSEKMLTTLGFYISSQIFKQIIEGVKCMHDFKPTIIHRDLHPSNIMLKISDNQKSFVKIVDLGLSTVHRYANQTHTLDRGCPMYVAPEVFSDSHYDTRTDIYSLGIVCRELFSIDVRKDYLKTIDDDILKNKYNEIQLISNKMTQQMVRLRYQSIDEILNERKNWLIEEKDFKARKELKNAKYRRRPEIYLNLIFDHFLNISAKI